ncbi:hypothetical protein GCM10009557_89590 [Virgisporangium ochraceum]
MTGDALEPVPVGRPLAVTAAWYAAVLALLACGFAPELAEAAAAPEQTCPVGESTCPELSTVEADTFRLVA